MKEKGILYVKDGRARNPGNRRLYVPVSLRVHMMHLYHRNKLFSHPGASRMYETMSNDYHWPGMQAEIRGYVGRCLACLRAKASPNATSGTSLAVVPEAPFAVIGIDVYGPFPITSPENDEDAGYR